MKKIILVLFTTLFLVLCNTVTAYEVIKPYVNDFAHTMTVEDIKDLNDYAIEIDNQTGFEIAVVTVTNTDGMEPLAYAQQLGQQFGVGKRYMDNGVVILWVTSTQRGAVATAIRARDILSDDYVTSLGKDNKHYFLEGNSHAAFGNIMKGIYEKINQSQHTAPVTLTVYTQDSHTVQSQDNIAINQAFGSVNTAMNFAITIVPIMMVIAIVFGIFNAFSSSFGGSSSSSSSSDDDDDYKKKKLPKKMSKAFMKRYKIVKRGKKYYRKGKDGKYRHCPDNTMLYLFFFLWMTSRHNPRSDNYVSKSEQASISSDSSSSSYSSGSFSSPSRSYSSTASSSGKFGGGGGFSGGSGGGGSF
jgi:uncharacterized membrane protein YgcG